MSAHESVHTTYEALRWHWRFCELSYLGGREYLEPDIEQVSSAAVRTGTGEETSERLTVDRRAMKSFLFPHNREENYDYEQRRARAFYRNLTRPIVDTYAAHVMGAGIDRDAGATPALDAFWLDADLRGSTADEFLRDGLVLAQVFGHAFCVVDMPRVAPADVRSVADKQALGLRPYATWFSPLSVVDWETDRFGSLGWVRLVERDWREARGGPGPQMKEKFVYRTWYADRWTLAEEGKDGHEGETVDEGPNPLGRVPVEVLYAGRRPGDVNPVGVSRIADIAFLNREVFNLDNMKQDLLYHQTFAFLTIPDPAGRVSRADIGIHRAFGYDPAGGGPPSYVGPPTEYVTAIREEIADLVLQIRALAGLSRGVGEQSIAARSGDALLVETQDKTAMLRALSHEAEDFETRLAALVAAWEGAEWTGHVRYGDDYQASALVEELDVALKYKDLGPPREASAEVLMLITRRLLRHLPERQLAAVLDAVKREAAEPKEPAAPPPGFVPPPNGEAEEPAAMPE